MQLNETYVCERKQIQQIYIPTKKVHVLYNTITRS